MNIKHHYNTHPSSQHINITTERLSVANYMGCVPGGWPSWDGSSIWGFPGLNCSADSRVNRIPTPSMRASSTPPMTALPAIAAAPFRAARIPPVAAPLMMLFQGSSFFRMCTRVQSMVENMPPQTAKLPPMMGARVFTATRLPAARRAMPLGAFRKPLMEWKTAPPIQPMVKAPPQSSKIRHGHGSREYSSMVGRSEGGQSQVKGQTQVFRLLVRHLTVTSNVPKLCSSTPW